MKKYLTVVVLFLFILSNHSSGQVVAGRMNEVFLKTDLSPANGLNDPWEITYGPDDSLWITESKGYAVYKMGPNGGTKRKVLDISQKSTWLGNTPASDSVFNLQFVFSSYNPQGGLAGLAIHPEYNAATPKKFVYVSYIRSYLSTAGGNAGVFFQNRIVRFTFNTVTGRLDSPVSLCDTLPGSSDHNSQRMIIAPVNGVNYLFYAQGDMGAGQFGNQNRTNNAQKTSCYEGKILRFNLEPDGDAGTLDKWIPNDNPFNTTSPAKQSAVWCIGIRNNQGFAYDSVRNILYGASHGPYSDDEINIIEPSKNYGHPLVIGYAADNNYNGSSAGAYPTSAVPVIASETANASAIGSSYQDPIFSAYAQPQATINNIWVNQPGNGGWPSEAWSGMDFYRQSIIPDWKNTLILASLKWGRILKLKLNATGSGIVPTNGQDTVSYFGSTNRFRDMAFSPDGKSLFVIMDKSATTSGPSAGNPVVPACPGCLQKYTFLGYNAAGGTSTVPNSVLIAAGQPGLCEDGNTITINSANNNNNLWVPITDTASNLIAEINANGNNLGAITTSLFTHTGTVREQGGTHSLYADRNITITPQTQPSSAVSIRIYLSLAEFNALKTAVNTQGAASGVANANDLSIYKNSDPCGPYLTSVPSRLSTTNQAAFGAGGYVFQANINSFSTFYLASTLSLLPVHLLSFKGTLVNGIGQLTWNTEDEKAIKSFVVERSINSRDFQTIGTLQPAGTATKSTYNFPDSGVSKLAAEIAYYRIKMVDADGQFRYSDVVRLNLLNYKGSISVHPNPAINDATIIINATLAEKINWELTDVTGKLIQQHSANLVKGDNTITIKLAKLPAGIYYLKVSGNDINQAIKLQKL